MGRISEENEYHTIIKDHEKEILDLVTKRESSLSAVSVTIDRIKKADKKD